MQPSVVIGVPLAIFSKVLDLMRATLARQSGSRKLLLIKATTNNSAYSRDWRSPGAPITSKWAFYLDGVHIFKNVCFCMFFYFSANRRDSRSPGTLF